MLEYTLAQLNPFGTQFLGERLRNEHFRPTTLWLKETQRQRSENIERKVLNASLGETRDVRP
jgi:hypothetical protein